MLVAAGRAVADRQYREADSAGARGERCMDPTSFLEEVAEASVGVAAEAEAGDTN